VGAIVPSTSDTAADETDPEVDVRAAYAAFGVFVIKWQALAWLAEVVLGISANGTTAALPLLETCAMENVLAYDSEQARGFVHPLKADGTCG
jgi:hypothetical protein